MVRHKRVHWLYGEEMGCASGSSVLVVTSALPIGNAGCQRPGRTTVVDGLVSDALFDGWQLPAWLS